MLYLIGLGLNEKGISVEGLEAVKKCKRIYLEGYTVEFPYSVKKLEGDLGRGVEVLGREDVEGDRIVNEARRENVGLLVYGSPLFATTHISLLEECKRNKVKFKVIYSTSIFDVISETGLQLYKFGKISSMPKWSDNFEPDSFLNYVIQNRKIGAHSLILIDIGLEFKDTLSQLERACKGKGIKIDKIVVCSKIGCKNSKIFYGNVEKLKKKKVACPFCFIISGKMHFLEEEILEGFS